MKKITTLSELAKICNCSTATVSYVLNGREDQRISEETKQKVLQMANLFQYRINPYAKALATGELHNIMFFYDYSDFTLSKSEVLNFINELSTFLKNNKYNLIVAPVNHTQKFSFVDAVLTYRISKEKFHELANKNFVPVISIDTIINDNLFYEIVNSFNDLKNDENILYLSTPFNDNQINDYLNKNFNIKFINSFSDLHNINTSKTIISLSIEIKKYLNEINIQSEYHCINTQAKYNAILDAINDSISRNQEKNHQIRV